MYAVLIELNVSEVDRNEGLKGLREPIVPAISQLPASSRECGYPATPPDEGSHSRFGTPRQTPGRWPTASN